MRVVVIVTMPPSLQQLERHEIGGRVGGRADENPTRGVRLEEAANRLHDRRCFAGAFNQKMSVIIFVKESFSPTKASVIR